MSADLNTSKEGSFKVSSDTNDLPKSNENTPKRITTSLELPMNSDKADIARKQLENLSKKPRKQSYTTISDSESVIVVSSSSEVTLGNTTPVSEVLYSGKPTMTNLSSAIITKEELENEIRRKIAKPDSQLMPTVKAISIGGEIEIPPELILSELTSPTCSRENVEIASQLDGQELIDILEGKPDEEEEGETYEVYGENGMIILKSENKLDQNQTTSYEIIATEDEKMAATKQKLLEREIAMRQIASMPTRKNRKLKQTQSSSSSVSSPTSVTSKQQQPTLAQSLAMDWSDREDEVILELENVVEETNGEPKIKILNMTILNEASEEIKSRSTPKLPVPTKTEPKILNKNAPQKVNPPKILNINAPQASDGENTTQKRGRVIKKKTIWDPSESRTSPQPPNKLPVALPSTITIKKLTKDSITKTAAAAANANTSSPALKCAPATENQQPQTRRGKKKSEIDKLFQDEGAVNMIYSLERQNNNQDVPEIKVNVDQKSLIDKSEEKSTLMVKTKTIKQTIMKQSTSPPEVKATPTRPQRYKRDLTPSITESEAEKKQEKIEKPVIITKVQKPTAVSRKKKTDDTWDFVRRAQTTCDDAMIIRRHSSSSYSSSATSPRRLSLDQTFNDSLDDLNRLNDQKNSFKFKKPQENKTPEGQQKDLKSCVGGLVEELRNTLSNKLAKSKNAQVVKGKKRAAAAIQSSESPPTKQRLSERRSHGGSDKEYQLTKVKEIAHIVLNSNPLTINLLNEMKSVLNQLENDDDCKVVLITPSESFSHGLDYSTLIQTTVDKRKQAASDLVTAVKNFLITLAAFPKILVCGLKGETSGIAVTMLPLFDVAIADSSAKFAIPHGKIGSNPEGISLLQQSRKINPIAITEMFYLNKVIDANTAINYGLISKVPKNVIEEEAKEICLTIASLSSQALESTKNILTEDFLISIDQQLTKEVKILQQQWISAECQENFKKHAATGSEW